MVNNTVHIYMYVMDHCIHTGKLNIHTTVDHAKCMHVRVCVCVCVYLIGDRGIGVIGIVAIEHVIPTHPLPHSIWP